MGRDGTNKAKKRMNELLYNLKEIKGIYAVQHVLPYLAYENVEKYF